MILRLAVFTVGLVAGSFVPKSADEAPVRFAKPVMPQAKDCPAPREVRRPAADTNAPAPKETVSFDLSNVPLTLLNAAVNVRGKRVRERIDRKYPSFVLEKYESGENDQIDDRWRSYVLRESTLLAEQEVRWVGHGDYRLGDSVVHVTAHLDFAGTHLAPDPEGIQSEIISPKPIYHPASLSVDFAVDGDSAFTGFGWAGRLYHVPPSLALEVDLSGTHQREAGAAAMVGLPFASLSTLITILDEDAVVVAESTLSWDPEPLEWEHRSDDAGEDANPPAPAE